MQFLLCALVVCLTAPVWPDIFQDAQWLRDPRMKGTQVQDVYSLETPEPIKGKGPWNLHTLFRKEISLESAPREALLYITGDDYYKFSINGQQIVQGPESGYPFAHPYYFLDVTPHLREGINVLGSHAYYQGLINRVWNSGDNRSGFICRLEVTYENGKRQVFNTDKSWLCLPLDAFQGMETTGYDTQFLENIDMRRMPRGWDHQGFDTSQWLDPLLGRQDHVFVRQTTPPLELERLEPSKRTVIDQGFLYDFGTEIAGAVRIRTQGKAGQQVVIRHAEELDATGRARFALRANCVYEEQCTLSGNEDLIEFYDYMGFRYVEVLGAPQGAEVWVEGRHHPWPAHAAVFTSSDHQLSAIWDLCRNTVKWSAQGGFLDCPTREKGQYLGDALITARAHLWLTGDASLTAKALADFQYSRQISPGLMAIAPGNTSREIAEFSLQYPLLLREYYWRTGDRGFTDLMATAVFPGLFAHFQQYENQDGLLEHYNAKEIMIDWPESLRDNYDWNDTSPGINTVLNAFYYGALCAAADLLRDLGRESLLYERHAQHVAEGFQKRLANAGTGLYVDASGSTHSSLHANALPLAFGLHAGADPEKMLELIRAKRLSCGVYFASYVIEACFKAGDAALAYDLLTSPEGNGWVQMLHNGATTCTETWAPSQKPNMSWCHGWGSSPIYLIAERVFGLSPLRPGWKGIRFAPGAVPGLPEMSISLPLPQGVLQASFKPGKGFEVVPPPGVEVKRITGGVNAQGRAGKAKVQQITAEQRAVLEAQGWTGRTGNHRAIWIDVKRQMLHVLEGFNPIFQARVATAKAGVGSEAGSQKTPLGWHQVAQKIGAGAAWGQVFRSRGATREIWKPGMDVTEDLVLTRVLWLDGLEPGKNKGRDEQGHSVDSKARCIYIHGTNGEHLIGVPSSHGCIRMYNDEVIALFDLVPEGAPVLITQ